MDRFLIKTAACSPVQAAALTDSILNMLVTDMRPLSMVEGSGFKAMISIFHQNYELPSRTFTKHLEKKYEDIKDKMKKALQETDSMALATDIWTSIATEAYMGVTCYYLKNWKKVSYCLTTMPLDKRTAAIQIQKIIDKFSVPPEKIKAIVLNNGANVVAAATILHEKHGWASVKMCRAHP